MRLFQMSKLALRLFSYKCFSLLGITNPLPMSVTMSVSGKCNSKCLTCNIWKKNSPEINTDEWRKVAENIGETPFWITITGGEPFMRKDLTNILTEVTRVNDPLVLNIATNGIETEKIVKDVKRVKKFYTNILRINISIDGIGKTHDSIRGCNSYKNAIETFKQLKRIKGVEVGFYTTASKYNAKSIDRILKYHQQFAPDFHHVEVAQQRYEMANLGNSIVPNLYEVLNCVKNLPKPKITWSLSSIAVRILRKRYYKRLIAILKNQKVRSGCYAGLAHVYVNPKGELLPCCVKKQKLGDLKKENIRTIMRSKGARNFRLEAKHCMCTMANAQIINEMCDFL